MYTLTVTLFEASRTQNEFYIERIQNEEFYIEFHTIKLTIAWEEEQNWYWRTMCVYVSQP